MSKWKKLLSELSAKNADMRFDEISKILYNYGYKSYETKGGSSHIIFRKPGCKPVTIPRHGKIKKAYIEIVKSIVEENEND